MIWTNPTSLYDGDVFQSRAVPSVEAKRTGFPGPTLRKIQ